MKKYDKEFKKEVSKEIHDHKITGAPARGTSNHTRGTAFDLVIRGIGGRQLQTIAKTFGVVQNKGHGEEHHFDFVGKPKPQKRPSRLFY